jgi:regulatory protein YycH of two-component signal transduction system YycFG
MTKIKENWLSILLVVVVILSMLLSALLWTNSLGYEWFANNDAEKGTTQQTALQSVGDIYLPTQVILTKSDESQQLLYGQKKNLILTLRNDMQKWQLSGFRRVARNDSSDYRLFVNR